MPPLRRLIKAKAVPLSTVSDLRSQVCVRLCSKTAHSRTESAWERCETWGACCSFKYPVRYILILVRSPRARGCCILAKCGAPREQRGKATYSNTIRRRLSHYSFSPCRSARGPIRDTPPEHKGLPQFYTSLAVSKHISGIAGSQPMVIPGLFVTRISLIQPPTYIHHPFFVCHAIKAPKNIYNTISSDPRHPSRVNSTTRRLRLLLSSSTRTLVSCYDSPPRHDAGSSKATCASLRVTTQQKKNYKMHKQHTANDQ